MKAKTWGYWGATILLAAMMGGGGVLDIVQPEGFLEEVEHLGYPAYMFVLLGVWKVLGVAAILLPRLPLLKEWAYAGFLFDTTGAFVSHMAVDDSPGELGPALLGVALTLGSWYLRPAGRRIGA